MAQEERDRARLEEQLAELTRRLSELENRIAEIEARPAAAAGPVSPAPQAAAQVSPAAPAPVSPAAQVLPTAPRPPAAQVPPIPQNPWEGVWPAQAQQKSQPPQGWVSSGSWDQRPRLPEPQWNRPQPEPKSGESEYPRFQPPRFADRSAAAGSSTAAPLAQSAAVRQSNPATPPPSLAEEWGVSLASFRDLESRLTGRLLAWVGAAAVALGSVFFLSLAFSRGWIGPEARVALGIAFGAAFTVVGAWLFGRRQESLGHVLVAVGLGVVSLSLFAGTRYYSLFPPEVALAGSFVAAVVAAAIAVRVNSQVVAIFGLLAIAAAPPIMGAGANTVTIAFLAVTVAGTTAISLAKSWRWLPPVAFAITAPQLIFWLTAKPDVPTAVAALAAYWLLHAVAASADELRTPQEARLEEEAARSATLFFLNSALALGGGLGVLSGNFAAWQGAYVAALALAHFAFGAYFVWRRGDMYPFGVFINAIGVAAVALAIERQFDGPAVAIGWAIEGAVLAAIYGYRRNVYAGGAAAILGTLAIAHLAVYEYPLLNWSPQGRSGPGPFAFADSAGLALASVLIAGFVAGWLSRRSDVRLALLIAGSFTVAYSLPFELSGPALVGPWAFEAVILVGVWRFQRNDYLGLTAATLGVIALAHFGVYEYAWLNWSLRGATGSGPFPFADSAGLTLGCLLVASVVAGLVSRSREVRTGLLVVGSLLVAYSLPFELSGPALVAALAFEGAALAAIWGLYRNIYLGAAAAIVGGLAVAHLCGFDYPADQWTLKGVVGPGQFAFADSAGLSLGCVLVAGIAAATLSRSHDVRCALTAGGLLLLAFVLPFELTGVALVAGWAILLPASMAAERLLDLLPGVPEYRARQRTMPVVEMNEAHWPDAPLLSAGVAAALAVANMLVFQMPLATATSIVVPATPFTDLATASAAIGVASFLLAAAITARPDLRVGAIVAAAGLAAYTMLFELALPFAVVAWCALAVALGAWSFRPSYSRWSYILVAGTFIAASFIAIMDQIVPIQRLGVQASVNSTGAQFALNAILAVGATALTVAAAARFLPLDRMARSALVLAAGIGLVYLASTLLVDLFQGRVGGPVALEELQKQAQVAVSILWALIGMGVFLTGLLSWRQGVRESGLGLLTLATGKVFLFDLSYLDVAYRVLSLIGLGLLLLVGAYAYQSLRPRRASTNAATAEASGEEAGTASGDASAG